MCGLQNWAVRGRWDLLYLRRWVLRPRAWSHSMHGVSNRELLHQHNWRHYMRSVSYGHVWQHDWAILLLWVHVAIRTP